MRYLLAKRILEEKIGEDGALLVLSFVAQRYHWVDAHRSPCGYP
jgi:hypothetical protein